MMTDTAVQQMINTNGQTLVNQTERQSLIQKLSTRFSPEISTRIENLAYEKSGGVKPLYLKFVQSCCQQIPVTYPPSRPNQQQQQPLQRQQQQQPQSQPILPSLSNTGQFVNPPSNSSSQLSMPMHTQPQMNPMVNQQPRFSVAQQQQLPSRMPNPQSSLINTQTGALGQVTRLREPQKFNQPTPNIMPYPPQTHNSTSAPTIDLAQQQQQQPINNNTTLSDYLTQPSILPNRFSNQSPVNSRPRPTTTLTGNFPSQSSSNNPNDILHKFVVGNLPTNSMAATSSSPMTNTSSTGDQILQKILSTNNDGASNPMPLPNRASMMVNTQPIRSVNTANNMNSHRPSLLLHHHHQQQQQPSPSSAVIVIPPPTQQPNILLQRPPNVTTQHSPSNNNNGLLGMPSQTITQPPSSVPMNNSTPLNNYSSPANRSVPLSGSGSISSPDEETINLIKYLKENIGRLQALCQKFSNEGNQEKARNAQAIHQQMAQFINNPTYESLSYAKHIRDTLERASNRPQQSNSLGTNVSIPNPPAQPINDINQFEKAFTEYVSRDQKKRLFLNKLFVEPLNGVINGVPHKKMRLDTDTNNSNRIAQQRSSINQLPFVSRLNNELNLLPTNIFSIERLPVSHTVHTVEVDDEYLSGQGIILQCKLSESLHPLIPPLRLRVRTGYPKEPPEVLSLTNTMPPKLEFTDDHPFFEQISTLFVAYLFKLPPHHTVTDILNIWRQSVQATL